MNEALFREVNERVLELNARFGGDQALLDFVCECGRGDCSERISLTRPEYERIRANARRFAVMQGHQLPDIELVVDETDRFVVVEKEEDDAVAVAEATDPR